MKIAATASYKAVPSILIVAPIGKTNLTILIRANVINRLRAGVPRGREFSML